MTEDQAKTRWCPFAHVVSAHPSRNSAAIYLGNRSQTGDGEEVRVPKNTSCLASGCMLWCWDDFLSDDTGRSEGASGRCGFIGARLSMSTLP